MREKEGPARLARGRLRGRACGSAAVNEHSLIIPPLLPEETNPLGAGVDMPKSVIFPRALSEPEIADIKASVKRIYLYGRIEYVTLGVRRSTDFRLFYTGAHPPVRGHTLTYSDGGNRSD